MTKALLGNCEVIEITPNKFDVTWCSHYRGTRETLAEAIELMQELHEQDECDHYDRELYCCLQCGKELDPSDYMDEDYGQER